MVGVVLGGLLGVWVPRFMEAIGFLGDLFIDALTVAILPLLLTTIVVRVFQMGNRQKVSAVTGKAILYFAVIGLVAAGIGLATVEVLRPGEGAARVFSDLYRDWSPAGVLHLPAWSYIGLVVFSLLFGSALSAFGSRARTMTNFLGQADQALTKVLRGLLYAAPLGMFSLVGSMIARDEVTRISMASLLPGSGQSQPAINMIVQAAAGYLLAVVLALLILAVIILPLTAKLFGKQPVIRLFGSMAPAVVSSFGASSSLAVLPFTHLGLASRQTLDSRAGALVAPLGPVLNVGATALCTVVATVFLAQASGFELSLFQYAGIVILPLLLAVGKVGLPYAVPAIVLTQISVLGLPAGAAAGLAMVLLVDWLVDRLRGAVNVWSDSVVAVVIAESFEFKTARVTHTRERERPPMRPRRPAGRGRGEAPAPVRRRTDQREPRRAREHRPEERRGRSRPAGKTAPGVASGTRAPASQEKPSRQESRSPFDMSPVHTPKLDMDVTGPADSPLTGDKADARVAGARDHGDRPERGSARGGRHRGDRTHGASAGSHGRQPDRGPTDDTGSGRSGRLSPETIARELKRVSERDDIEGSEGFETGGESHAEPETQPVPLTSPEPPGDEQTSSREAAGPPGDREETEASAPESETVGETEQPSIPEGVGSAVPESEEKEAGAQYGRPRSRRGEKFRNGHKPPEPGDEEIPEAKDKFSREEVTSFGRTKRKKTR
ncbi:MAG TPA: cation:dicarboxylase symporter family transporter [Acidobacteriota bacterium]|nr:cation:dicarboxylase symporter family transporter [Acidobacteriota bacterium]